MEESIKILKDELLKVKREGPATNGPLGRRFYKGEIAGLERAIRELERRVWITSYIRS